MSASPTSVPRSDIDIRCNTFGPPNNDCPQAFPIGVLGSSPFWTRWRPVLHALTRDHGTSAKPRRALHASTWKIRTRSCLAIARCMLLIFLLVVWSQNPFICSISMCTVLEQVRVPHLISMCMVCRFKWSDFHPFLLCSVH